MKQIWSTAQGGERGTRGRQGGGGSKNTITIYEQARLQRTLERPALKTNIINSYGLRNKTSDWAARKTNDAFSLLTRPGIIWAKEGIFNNFLFHGFSWKLENRPR